MSGEILVLRQDSLGLTSKRSFDDLFVGVSVEMVGGEVRADPVTFLPILHTCAYGHNLSSHIRAWNEIRLSVLYKYKSNTMNEMFVPDGVGTERYSKIAILETDVR